MPLIVQLLAAPEAECQDFAARAFRLTENDGLHAEAHREVEAVRSRDGPLVATAALVVTARAAQARYPPQRLRFFRSVALDLAHRIDLHRLTTPDVRSSDAGPAPFVAPPARSRRGFTPNARERANGLTIAELEASGRRTLAMLRALDDAKCDHIDVPRTRPGREP
ncbi:MAG: hypothetical protein AAF624_07600 [Bacteroidota bacterium]